MENRKKFSKWIFLIPIILFFSLFFLNNKSKETIKTEINVTPKMEASASASASPSAVSLLPIPSEAPRIISSTGIPILTYHYITNNPNPEDVARNSLEVPPDKFEEQMIYLSTINRYLGKYHLFTANELAQADHFEKQWRNLQPHYTLHQLLEIFPQAKSSVTRKLKTSIKKNRVNFIRM